MAAGRERVALSVALSAAASAFVSERHLATLSTLRADGSPHVVPVGFTWDAEAGVARVIASRSSVKVRNAARGGRAVLCQVDGRRWLALEGVTRVREDPASVRDAEDRYAVRYRPPRPNPQRVVVEVVVDRVLGSVQRAPAE
ncbi:MAG TPA: TIGR03618 family F420-dependent PPOX class oxidoreductase [Dermatophilaceae bacterium]|nr:TIGR03618 family F420-dependent PPOX class oxidoreductase [Dermatophilaceae bacterium]